MKQSLQLKLGQQLTMTPQLQQAIRLLQLSTLDLQQEIQEALDSNPMLEHSEDSSEIENSGENSESTSESGNEKAELNGDNGAEPKAEAPANEAENSDSDWNDDIPADLAVDTSWDDIYPTAPSGSGLAKPDNDDFDFESRQGTSESLQDYLSWQLNLTPMSDADMMIAEAIIDAVEPSGQLGHSIEDIYEGLCKEIEELEIDEVIAVLHRIQQFDPVGVASQDISECLLLQLKQFPEETVAYKTAEKLISNYLPMLGSRDFKQLMRKLRVKEPELKDAINLIQSLNPKPGEQIGEDNTEYVVPDVFVSKESGRWTVNLNPEISPRLRINPDYASLVRRADNSSDNAFLRDNLQEARWFIKSLQSRNETLLKVATCIVERQQGFLDHGPEAMKPMVLHDVAEMVEMHESTISRVTTQKYMHTPQGILN